MSTYKISLALDHGDPNLAKVIKHIRANSADVPRKTVFPVVRPWTKWSALISKGAAITTVMLAGFSLYMGDMVDWLPFVGGSALLSLGATHYPARVYFGFSSSENMLEVRIKDGKSDFVYVEEYYDLPLEIQEVINSFETYSGEARTKSKINSRKDKMKTAFGIVETIAEPGRIAAAVETELTTRLHETRLKPKKKPDLLRELIMHALTAPPQEK